MTPTKEVECPSDKARTQLIENANQQGWEIHGSYYYSFDYPSFSDPVDVFILEKGGKQEVAGVVHRNPRVWRDSGKPLVFGPEELLEGIEESQK